MTKSEQALEKLKHVGVRMTPQRHAILNYMLSTMTHPTADEIYRALEHRFPNMSVATVYNNLKVFIEAGLVRELTYGDDSSRFEADMSDHYHAICENCGKIVDFDHPPVTEIERSAAASTGFLVRGHRLEVYGLCPDCARQEGEGMTH
ncbi:peroxide-responsive transcriptional repressor PerR [Paenibacillus thermoaerophilus]|uniref:Peroxide-responsive transcriptional repressor PerR n=1 Tax=Paenibacillus thermoaerophilus TaxID=1215385 RepID=A0ABW2V4D3_9BACL|nr:peroxide-responsive transcriptional repressor PerR [Paenibacillus thermoaerophilus]TMV16099.1 peroxide-responsive transcriptional repressor PerR [Paenibacillus thermoaerophilus]